MDNRGRGTGKKRRRKKRQYIEYDYEALYNQSIENLDEYFVEKMLEEGKSKCEYATKEIRAGQQLEIEIYPEFSKQQAQELPDRVKEKQRKAQRNLNDKNSRKEFIRTAEHNFNNGDYWITLTYEDEYLPASMEVALKNMQKYIRNINGKRKRRGLENAKYMYVTEWIEDGGEPVRCHHHLIMDSGLDMDTVESTWKHGRRNECRRISKDDNGIAGMTNYMMKEPKGRKRWCASTNLQKPPVKKHHQTKKKTVHAMVKNHDYIQQYLENNPRYQGYTFTDSKVYYNDFNARFYIYARMRRTVEPAETGGKKKE